MNKYLEKVAKVLSDENKQVAKTFVESSVVGLPAAIIGSKLGNVIGAKYGKPGVGQFIGGHVIGGVAELGALKHGFSAHSKTIRNKKNEQH